jgi:hypothetical protein
MLILNLFTQALFSSRTTRTFAILTTTFPHLQTPSFSLPQGRSHAAMDQVSQNFDTLWTKSLVNQSDKSSSSQTFHKARLDSVLFRDMLDYLKKEFYNSQQNIFEVHLFLVDTSLKNKACPFKHAKAAFINHAFTEFHNQQKNICKRQLAETDANAKPHLITGCTKADECLCNKTQAVIVRAFELTVSKNMLMFSSFNKIYNFNENIDHLQASLTECFKSIKKVLFTDRAILIGELQVYDAFPLEQVDV